MHYVQLNTAVGFLTLTHTRILCWNDCSYNLQIGDLEWLWNFL